MDLKFPSTHYVSAEAKDLIRKVSLIASVFFLKMLKLCGFRMSNFGYAASSQGFIQEALSSRDLEASLDCQECRPFWHLQ